MIETIRRIESPNPPQCDFCREPAALRLRLNMTTEHCCEVCLEKRRSLPHYWLLAGCRQLKREVPNE
jgi:hypothetical protein